MVNTIKKRFLEYVLFRSEEAKYLENKDIGKQFFKILIASMFVVLFSYLMMETQFFGLWVVPFVIALGLIYDRFVLIFSWIKKNKKNKVEL